MKYRPDRRDPLTQRYARTLAECDRNPWAYSEGPSEPQYLTQEPESDGDRVDRLLRRYGLATAIVVVLLIAAGVL